MNKSLALKYRPKNFNDLVGQEEVSISLINALNLKKISNAYLFSGLRGSGKTSSARILAKSLICEKGISANPCEGCENCKSANENRHLDIIEIDGASHRKIEDVKDIIEQTRYAPSKARYKIFIIDEVHMLTKEAFNALLKTLEEPPSYVIFILATTEIHKIPATILSRTQHFRFNPIKKEKIISRLEFILQNENIKYEKEAIEILVRSSSGSLRDNVTLLEQAIIYCNNFINVKDVRGLLGLVEFERLDNLFEIISLKDRANAINIIKEFEDLDIDILIDEMIFYLKSKFLNFDQKFSLLTYERFFRILSECRNLLNFNTDNSYVLMMIIFMMMEALNFDEISKDLIERDFKKDLPKEKKLDVLTNDILDDKIEHIFDKLSKKISDRNYELGEIFSKNVEFVELSNNTLILNSNASGDDKELLRKGSKVIVEILNKIDPNLKIKIAPKKVIKPELDFDALKPLNKEIKDTAEPIKEEPIKKEIAKEEIKEDKISKQELKAELDKLFGEPKKA